MKTKFQILILIIFTCCISSCNEDPVTQSSLQQENFKYPFEINTFWYYASRNFKTNLRPDSISVYIKTDTLLGYGGTTFVKDTIINSDTLRLLSSTHSEPGHEHTTLEYYKQTDSGLIRVASYSNGTSFGPYSSVEINHRFELNGMTFNSIRDILDYYKKDYSDSGKIVFDNPPITTLKYPIIKNQEWHLIANGQNEIRKKYTDFETVTVPAGTFYCNKVKRNWYYNNAGPDPKIISYDYFSKDGMIKRDLFIKDILVWGNFNQPVGYIDVREEIEVNIYTHP